MRTVAVAIAFATSTVALSSCAQTSSAKDASAGPCAAHVVVSAIPSWARGGFSDPNRHMHFEVGRDGKIVALLWAYPLLSPPPTTHNNKILWVSHIQTNGSALQIGAQRMTGSKPVGPAVYRHVAGGPGPSIIDLPVSGCWRLDLRWSGQRDSLDLDYAANHGT